MSELSWFVYQNQKQLGPFTSEQVLQLYNTQMLSEDSFLFKAGWKDWVAFNDCRAELGLPAPQPEKKPAKANTAPRATVSGRVIVHNNGDLVIGKGVNISSSGIFIETTQQIFTLGERLKLSVKVVGLGKAFNAQAEVIRFNEDPRWPLGYGLSFLGLEAHLREEIDNLVRKIPDKNRLKHAQ